MPKTKLPAWNETKQNELKNSGFLLNSEWKFHTYIAVISCGYKNNCKH